MSISNTFNVSCIGSIWAGELRRLYKFVLYTVTDQDIVFSGIWFMLSNGMLR